MNQRPVPLFSLVAPTFNEAANIEPFLRRVTAVLDQHMAAGYEVIVVDDDSPDGTAALAEEFARSRPAVSVIRRRGERGLATAVVRGWEAARGKWLGVID